MWVCSRAMVRRSPVRESGCRARCGYEGEAFTCKGEWVLVGVDVSNGEESRGSGIVCV